MRIIAGAWRGRALTSPQGQTTRPTADRVRQALFDRLMHAPWAGRQAIEGAKILDGFAGTGALGLEALSRGAAQATFFEHDKQALIALRANIAACTAQSRCDIHATDILNPPPGTPHTLIFLDPPYGKTLLEPALAALRNAGWIAPDALLTIETARDEDPPPIGTPLTAFQAGAAKITVFRVDSVTTPPIDSGPRQ